jgi:aquaporin Z
MTTPSRRIPWSLLPPELAGTGLPVPVGLSLVVLMSGAGTPMAALIAPSAIGRERGAHINPAVTMGFWLMGSLNATLAAGDVVAKLCGGEIARLYHFESDRTGVLRRTPRATGDRP